MATQKQVQLMAVLKKEIEASDFSEPVAYVDVSAWARKCRWTVAETRGVYGSLIQDGLLLTDVTDEHIGADRAARLSARDGGYEGCVPTCWFPGTK